MSNIICEVPTQHKVIALTFDDGPHPIYTPQLLKILQQVNGKATFYMIGTHMTRHPEIVKQVTEGMHEIGNHTYTHPHLTQLGITACKKEINTTDQLIQEMTGVRPTTFRPPFLDSNDEVSAIVESFGYHLIGALNLDSKDWEHPGVEHIVSTSIQHVRNGSILLFHEGFGDRSQTVEAVQEIIYLLVNQGYQLVTVSELIRLSES